MNSKSTSKTITGLLGASTKFQGKINFDGTLRIDGDVYGEIYCKGDTPSTVIITERAMVEADIVADVVVVSGSVLGNIKAIKRLELHAPGRIEGMVYTSDFYIRNGALFQGECIMIRHLSAKDKRTLKLEGFYNIHFKEFIAKERQNNRNAEEHR